MVVAFIELQGFSIFCFFYVAYWIPCPQACDLEAKLRYCNSEYPDQLLVLKSLDDHKATFEHRPLFGEALVVHEDLDSLRKWKATKKDVTTMCPKAVCIARLPHNLDMVQKEMDKAQATALLMEAYMTNKPNDDTLLAFTCHPANLVLMKNVKKKQLKLYRHLLFYTSQRAGDIPGEDQECGGLVQREAIPSASFQSL